MSVGLATRESITSAWIVSALKASFYECEILESGQVRVCSDTGPMRIGVESGRSLLRLTASLGDGSALRGPGLPGAADASLAKLRSEMQVARIAWYPEEEHLMAEYDLPVHDGLTRQQLLVTLRAFLKDLTLARHRARSR